MVAGEHVSMFAEQKERRASCLKRSRESPSAACISEAHPLRGRFGGEHIQGGVGQPGGADQDARVLQRCGVGALYTRSFECYLVGRGDSVRVAVELKRKC